MTAVCFLISHHLHMYYWLRSFNVLTYISRHINCYIKIGILREEVVGVNPVYCNLLIQYYNRVLRESVEHPRRTFNSDEGGLLTCSKSGKLWWRNRYENVYEISSRSEEERVTALCIFSAKREAVNPMIVCRHKKILQYIVNFALSHFAIGRSNQAGATFYKYIANLFYPLFIKNKTIFLVLLLVSGHKTHINEDLYNLCIEKWIILYCLFSNTHILQSCDVSIFRLLKNS